MLPKQPYTILILDKDPATLELYQRALSREYLVKTCQTASEARWIIAQENVFVLILEPAGLGQSAWDLLSDRDDLKKNEPILVVICSTQDLRRISPERGASACLVKPVLPSQLVETIQDLLDGFPQRKVEDGGKRSTDGK